MQENHGKRLAHNSSYLQGGMGLGKATYNLVPVVSPSLIQWMFTVLKTLKISRSSLTL